MLPRQDASLLERAVTLTLCSLYQVSSCSFREWSAFRASRKESVPSTSYQVRWSSTDEKVCLLKLVSAFSLSISHSHKACPLLFYDFAINYCIRAARDELAFSFENLLLHMSSQRRNASIHTCNKYLETERSCDFLQC